MKPASRAFLITAVVLVVVSLAITASVAQGNRGAFGPRGGMMDGSCFVPGLNLTDQQKAQIQDYIKANRQQCLEVRNSNLTPEQKQKRLAELQMDCRAGIEKFLTPAQRERAKQFWSQRSMNGRGRPGFPAIGMRGKYGLEQLGLTKAQKEKIDAIQQDTQKQVQAVRLNANLTDKQKAEKIRDIRETGHNKVLQVLTPDQRQKLEQWRASSPAPGKNGSMGKPGGMRGGGMGRGMMRNPGPQCPLP